MNQLLAELTYQWVDRFAARFGARGQLSRSIGSSQYQAIADDSLKDEDNAAWVMRLEPDVRERWIERIAWIRLVDRLAEAELVCPPQASLAASSWNGDRPLPPPGRFQSFYAAWKAMIAGELTWDEIPLSKVKNTTERTILEAMLTAWCVAPNCQPKDELAQATMAAWDRYLDAILTYHRLGNDASTCLNTATDCEQMLDRLAGSFFQVLPFLQVDQLPLARGFGQLDQFYNILRDQAEDARQGICYLPQDLLDRFGIAREDILSGAAAGDRAYRQMMQVWLVESRPRLYQAASGLLLAEDLHPSWGVLREWSLHRYARIERVLRSCNFDYLQFPNRYWPEVRRDLDLWRRRGQGKLTQPSLWRSLLRPFNLCYSQQLEV